MIPGISSQISPIDSVLGMLAVVQMAWLPGHIAMRSVRFPSGLMRILVGFAFSLWWNLIVVLSLSSLGLLGRPGMLWVMVFEVALLGAVCLVQKEQTPPPREQADTPTLSSDPVRGVALFAFLCLLLCVAVWAMAIGDTFFRWDAVASWNRWATEWAFDGQPKAMRDYPQLVPATWSVSYLLIGHDQLQQFARSIQGLFPLMILGGLFCAGMANRSKLLLRAVPITFFLIWILYKPFFISGYMDIPVAALTTLSWCLILQARSYRDRSLIIRTVMAGAFVAGVSGACKQAGLVMIVSFPVLVIILIPSEFGVKRIRLALLSLGMILMVLLSWYGYSGWRMWTGQETFIGAELVGSFHPRPSLSGRLHTAFERLVPPFTLNNNFSGSLTVWIFLATSFLGILHKTARPIVLAVALPSWFIWAFGFSYSTRNMAVAVPAMGVGMAGSYTVLLDFAAGRRGESLRKRARDISPWIWNTIYSKPAIEGVAPLLTAGLVLVAASAIGWVVLDSESLAQSQIQQRSKLGVPAINSMLFEADSGTQRLGQIASSYAILRHIPSFEDRTHFLPPTLFDSFERHMENPMIDSVLVRDVGHIADDPRIIKRFRELVLSGDLIELGEHAGWTIALKKTVPASSPPVGSTEP